MVELKNLPTEMLQHLFEFLDAKALINTSETCSQFNKIISASERLTRKFNLVVKYPFDSRNFQDMIAKSKRKYRNLTLIRIRDRTFERTNMSSNFLAKLGSTVTSLKLDWCLAARAREALFEIMIRRNIGDNLRERDRPDRFDRMAHAQAQAQAQREETREDIRREFVEVIRHFQSIQKLHLISVHLEVRKGQNEPELSFTALKELKLFCCDAFCFDLLSSCLTVEKLKVHDPFWNSRNPGIDNFESFLLKQDHLKILDLKSFYYPRLFHQDRSSEINFQLETLILRSVFFADKDFAANFFRTQNNIKHISFQLHNEKIRLLDEAFWYNNIMKTIICNNPQLETFVISKLNYRIDHMEFLTNVINRNVKSLDFYVTSDDSTSKLFKEFLRIFPNLKTINYKAEESDETNGIICFDQNTTLNNVDSLTITNSSVRSLVNVHAGNLMRFEYIPGRTGEFIDDYFGGFLHRHRNISNLVIGKRSERSYFFVSYNLCELIVNFLTKLETITVYNFAEVNRSVKLLCNLNNLKVLTLSSEQYQQFTAKTKVECSRKNLKLIPVDIPRKDVVNPKF